MQFSTNLHVDEYVLCSMIPELNAAEKELLDLLRREMADDKKFNASKVRLTFTPCNPRSCRRLVPSSVKMARGAQNLFPLFSVFSHSCCIVDIQPAH